MEKNFHSQDSRAGDWVMDYSSPPYNSGLSTFIFARMIIFAPLDYPSTSTMLKASTADGCRLPLRFPHYSSLISSRAPGSVMGTSGTKIALEYGSCRVISVVKVNSCTPPTIPMIPNRHLSYQQHLGYWSPIKVCLPALLIRRSQ